MERRKTDSEIKQQVLRELKWDSRIAWAQVGVEVSDGVVTLSGAVSSYANKSAANLSLCELDRMKSWIQDIAICTKERFR